MVIHRGKNEHSELDSRMFEVSGDFGFKHWQELPVNMIIEHCSISAPGRGTAAGGGGWGEVISQRGSTVVCQDCRHQSLEAVRLLLNQHFAKSPSSRTSPEEDDFGGWHDRAPQSRCASAPLKSPQSGVSEGKGQGSA